MAEVFKMPKYPCPFCKKREATQLCDFIIDHFFTTAKDEKGRMIGMQHETCNNQMCTKCMTVYGGLEFCPSCSKLWKYIQDNHERKPGRLYYDTLFGRNNNDR
ncbi:RNA polymerase subunit RPABC4/transcription elongation factor Spt4 [Paenibacillus peoriae]|uniref:RNA polymerase subunit RPABC4/transcription elongation factor Spt4 n=1 Tax=Paenibacillus peoriae TaxID=59893 RepID=A0ABU1Q9I0_9BACL|nr:RNA polymerase subunit RPABC4/transcription elongation factor Spt4 [Paenibacillus peoriae]OMF46576.1 hypothetical protein BK135_12130 [Paenibacillus peoriae]